MSNIKQLSLIVNDLKQSILGFEKLAKQNGEYGGKGPFELPKSHVAAIKVPKGGSCCDNCKFVDRINHSCNNKYYIQWNGGNKKLPDLPLDEICSDWFEPEK